MHWLYLTQLLYPKSSDNSLIVAGLLVAGSGRWAAHRAGPRIEVLLGRVACLRIRVGFVSWIRHNFFAFRFPYILQSYHIDLTQKNKLETMATIRNNCAHPGTVER